MRNRNELKHKCKNKENYSFYRRPSKDCRGDHPPKTKQALLLRQKGETQSSYLTCPNLCPGNLSLLSKLFPLHHTLWACKVRLHRKTEKSQSQLTRQLIFFYMFTVVVLCILYSHSASSLPSLLSGCVIIKSNLDSMKLVVCTMELNSLLEKMNCLQTAPHSTRGHQSRQHRLRRLPIQQNRFHF